MAKPIPEGYHALTPSLAVDNAAQAIEFYKRAFGAKRSARRSACA
jgi:PhnB protein